MYFCLSSILRNSIQSLTLVANLEAYSPARGMINKVHGSYEDHDGNFVEQFQTTGFDSRIWELYLHAYLLDAEFYIHPSASPDFVASKGDRTLAIEAVTSNPTQGVYPSNTQCSSSVAMLYTPPFDMPFSEVDGAFQYKQEDFVPIKLGSALFSKLKKHYWKAPEITGVPLIFAIETFHEKASLHYSSAALGTYLYGYRQQYFWNANGALVTVPQKVDFHVFAGKSIPSGFFFQPDASHVSAVLFSNSGTIAKFNRMGHQGSFYNPKLTLIRHGTCYDPDPDAVVPNRFTYTVGDPESWEWWGQGLEMFHNPVAEHPVDRSLFPDIAHHRLDDGFVYTENPEFRPIASITMNITTTDERRR